MHCYEASEHSWRSILHLGYEAIAELPRRPRTNQSPTQQDPTNLPYSTTLMGQAHRYSASSNSTEKQGTRTASTKCKSVGAVS
eukprot:4751764-Amphidinium_carterae.1